MCRNLKTTSVPIRFDDDGVIAIAPRGTKTAFFMQSIFCRTLARREAHRTGKYREEVERPLPVFIPLTDEPIPAGDAGPTDAVEDS